MLAIGNSGNIATMSKVTVVLVLASAAGAQFYFPEPSPRLGGDVVTYGGAVAKTKGGKPGYLETFVDPYFGSKVTRVSGDEGQPIPDIGGT